MPCPQPRLALNAAGRGRAPLWHQPCGAGRAEEAEIQHPYVPEAAACQGGHGGAISADCGSGGAGARNVGVAERAQLRGTPAAGLHSQGGRP
jgi:hypothetical protein